VAIRPALVDSLFTHCILATIYHFDISMQYNGGEIEDSAGAGRPSHLRSERRTNWTNWVVLAGR
jgi:hypothetical protein